jgi:succinoglycan biosynthesis transport protein ExoP
MLYYITTPASYTAGGTIVIDKRKLQLFQKESVLGDVEVDTAAVQTEVEVLKSDNIGLSVVRKLHLADDPEFVGGTKGPIGRLIAVIGRLIKFSAAEEALSEIDRENEALLKFNGQRTLSRVGMTYVIDIGFTSHDRDKSARIVNAIADAYIDDQLNAKYQATRRASLWLQERGKQFGRKCTVKTIWRR